MAKKSRVQVPSHDAADALFASDRTCCKCRISGKNIQIHHIDENPANNGPSNLAVLCLECHDETQVRGGFGRRLSAAEVTRYRVDWIARVLQRRDSADALAAEAMAGASRGTHSSSASSWTLPTDPVAFPRRVGLAEYIPILPVLRRRAYLVMHARAPSTQLATVEAYLELTAVLQGVLANLLSYYPEGHFSEQGHEQYVSQLVAERAHWHYLRSSDQGVGQSGSLVQTSTAFGVVRDLERLIDETVSTLTGVDLRHPDDAHREPAPEGRSIEIEMSHCPTERCSGQSTGSRLASRAPLEIAAERKRSQQFRLLENEMSLF
jgi:hypothetical protein